MIVMISVVFDTVDAVRTTRNAEPRPFNDRSSFPQEVSMCLQLRFLAADTVYRLLSLWMATIPYRLLRDNDTLEAHITAKLRLRECPTCT